MQSNNTAYRLRGVAGVWVSIMFGLVIVMVGMAMDVSYVGYSAQQLQIAADASSLAGGSLAKTDIIAARLLAQATAADNTAGATGGVRDSVLVRLNEANLPDGDIVTGRYYRWDHPIEGHSAGDFVETMVIGEVNAVKVVARRTDTSLGGALPLLFGPAFGVDSSNVTRDAIAMVVGSTGAGLIVLCPDCACALKFGGNTELTLTTVPEYDGDASIIVDSDATGCSPNAGAVCGSGGALDISAPEINMVAEGPESSCWSGNPTVPPLNPGSPYVPDPLAGLPEPTINEAADLGCIGGAGCDTTACQGGLSDGIHCLVNADCPPDPGTCGPTGLECNGGPNAGVACATDAECAEPTSCSPISSTCTGGPNAGAACASDAECPNWSCNVNVMTCIDGPLLGAPCVNNGDCTNSGACGAAMTACNGGTNNGYACMDHSDCPGGLCWAAPTMCHEGDNPDVVCLEAGDCPNGSCVITVRARPGLYLGGFRINASNVKLILDSGVYSLDNLNDEGPDAGLVINGGHFDATSGVMLHIIRDGVVHLAGSGDIWIAPITDETDLYVGVSIFQSRTNYNEAVIIGTTNMVLQGTYYFPNNPVQIGGVGLAVGNQLIAWTLYLHGTGTYTIEYDGRNPAPGYKVFLVE